MLHITDLIIEIPAAKKIQILKINIQSAMNLDVSDFNSTILQQVSVEIIHNGFVTRVIMCYLCSLSFIIPGLC